jgi:small nuclear ribonucleoprotein (snRNP)-like protein
MDYSSIVQYLNQKVLLTLKNGFWYKAKIISVTEQSVVFIELKGRKISVSPEQIVLIEGVEND